MGKALAATSYRRGKEDGSGGTGRVDGTGRQWDGSCGMSGIEDHGSELVIPPV